MRFSVMIAALLPALFLGLVATRLDDRRPERTVGRFLSEIRAAGNTDNRRRNIAMQGLKTYLATLTAAAVPTVEARLQSEPRVDSRIALVQGLGSMNVPEGAGAITRHLQTLGTNDVDVDDGAVRAELFAGFAALQVMTDPSAFEALHDLLPTLPGALRPFALTAMAGKPEVFSHLDRIEAALGSRDANVRAAAALALRDGKQLASPEAVDRVVAALEATIARETEPVAIQGMIVALGSHRRPSSIDVLESVLLHRTLPRTRERAVDALLQIGGRRVGEVLERHAERETHARIRVKAQEGAIGILEGGG